MALVSLQERTRPTANAAFPTDRAPPVGRARELVADFARVSGAKGAIALAYILATALLEAFSLSLLIPLLGLVLGGQTQSGHMGKAAAVLSTLSAGAAPFKRLVLLLLIFTLLISLRAVLAGIRDLSVIALQMRFTSALRLRLAQKLAFSRWDHIARLRHARITQLMGADIQRLTIGIEFVLRSGAAAVVVAAQCAFALVLDPVLAMAMMLLLGLALITLGGAMTRTHQMGGFALEGNLALLNGTSQFLGGLKLAISQNLEDSFVRETGETLRQLSERLDHFMRKQTWARIVLTVLAAMLGSVLLLAGYGWLHTPPAILLTFALLGTRMVSPMGQIQQGAQQFATVLPVYESFCGLEAELTDTIPTQRVPPSDYPEGPVAFRHVSHQHASAGDKAKGLHDFSLTLMPGEFLGVSGASGAGKTTFADLLAGLYPPQAGEILAGGKRLEGSVLATWRQHLSYISQDAFLFHDTIRRNLSWANSLADEDAMWCALAVAGADEFVRGLPEGLDTLVGERGTLVSGGERQRIALARALLRTPRLLVMDEATNAMDSAGERAVLLRLAALEPRPSIVVITHRHENLDLCGRTILIGGNPGANHGAA
jgi:ATP-binding cassette, subfamily C, bacterial